MWKRLDDGWANVEAALAIGMLLLMIVVAFAQAFLRNMTQEGFGWANAGLAWLDWADFILSKGTLWVAFLGASLAVHSEKHVAIDVVQRLAGPKVRMAMRFMVGFVGFVICLLLAKAFGAAVAVNGAETAAAYEVMTPDGGIHLCDATAAQLAESDMSKGPFCLVRGVVGLFGVVMQTPGAAFQLIVPVAFFVMALRFLAIGIRDLKRFLNNDLEDDISTHGLTGAAHDVADDLSHQEGR
jgi:TRAP-type C4-dicarboxylate transport system permease small subunit